MKDCPDITPPVAVLMAALVGLCGWFSFGVTRKLISFAQNSQRTVTLKADPYYLETYLRHHKGSLSLLGRDVPFARLLTTDASDKDYADALAAANQELAIKVKVYPYLEEISLVDNDGLVVASSDESQVGGKRDDGVDAGPEARVSNGPADIRAFVDEDRSFTVLIPVSVADRIVGIVVVQIGSGDAMDVS